MLPPIPRCSDWAYPSLIQPGRISLPRYGSRVGLHIILFEACSADEVWAHHLTVLMLELVAVPHVQTRLVKQGLHPRDLTRVSDDRVLEPCLPGLRWASHAIKRLTVDD